MPHALLKDFKSKLAEFVAQNLGKLQAMAIAKVQEEVQKIIDKLKNQCPPVEELEKLNNTISGIRTVVIGIEAQVDKLRPLPDKLTPVIIGGTVVVEILSHMPMLSTVGTPPGPGGGVVFSVPTGVIQGNANRLNFANNLVNTVTNEQKSIKDLLATADGIFAPIRANLDLIQSLIDACMTNQSLTDEERKRLIDSAQSRVEDSLSTVGVPYRSKSGRDYTIKVIKDPKSPQIAPKRQAIVQDFRGITVLTGPSSFASRTDILIKEIKFRIDNQLP
jgi:hypothetical protein